MHEGIDYDSAKTQVKYRLGMKSFSQIPQTIPPDGAAFTSFVPATLLIHEQGK